MEGLSTAPMPYTNVAYLLKDGVPIRVSRISSGGNVSFADVDAKELPALGSNISGSLTISFKPGWRVVEYFTGDRTFGRLRAQMKAKLRGKNWRGVR